MAVAAERVCCTPASAITQKFIHIEQHMEFPHFQRLDCARHGRFP